MRQGCFDEIAAARADGPAFCKRLHQPARCTGSAGPRRQTYAPTLCGRTHLQRLGPAAPKLVLAGGAHACLECCSSTRWAAFSPTGTASTTRSAVCKRSAPRSRPPRGRPRRRHPRGSWTCHRTAPTQPALLPRRPAATRRRRSPPSAPRSARASASLLACTDSTCACRMMPTCQIFMWVRHREAKHGDLLLNFAQRNLYTAWRCGLFLRC